MLNRQRLTGQGIDFMTTKVFIEVAFGSGFWFLNNVIANQLSTEV